MICMVLEMMGAKCTLDCLDTMVKLFYSLTRYANNSIIVHRTKNADLLIVEHIWVWIQSCNGSIVYGSEHYRSSTWFPLPLCYANLLLICHLLCSGGEAAVAVFNIIFLACRAFCYKLGELPTRVRVHMDLFLEQVLYVLTWFNYAFCSKAMLACPYAIWILHAGAVL